MSLSNPAEQKMEREKKKRQQSREKKDLNNKCTDKAYVARSQRCEKWHRNIVAATTTTNKSIDIARPMHTSTLFYL